MEESRLTRRASLVKLGGLLAGALAAGGWKAAEKASGAGVGPAGVASGAVTCVLTPEQTEGPYYIADEKVRRNITEGKPGAPLTLKAMVVDASTCKPIKGAAVDIWHADATGVYSGFGQARAAAPSCAGSRRPTRRASPRSGLSIRAGIKAVRFTSM
jgi:hypothetical protein